MFHFGKSNKNKNSKKMIDDIYFKSIEYVHEDPEYIQNEIQINSIRNLIAQQSGVSEKLLDWLIESVEENTAIEYEFANKKIYKKLLK